LFQLGHVNRERHGSCKKRTIIPSYSSFLQTAVNADVPEGTNATIHNGITAILLNSCLLASASSTSVCSFAGMQQSLKIILTVPAQVKKISGK